LSTRLAVLCVILVSAIGCGGNYSPSPASPSPSPTPSVTPTPAGPTSSVTIPVGASTLGSAAYQPGDLNIAAGTMVTWTNADSISHTSTSNVNGFDSGTVAPGGRFSFTFQTAGTFPYHCAIHPGMVGTVVVR
jgi:plastocyanin